MRILHVLDHSPPQYSAYSSRALALLQAQRARGWHTIQLTGPAQGESEAADRNQGGFRYFRTTPPRGLLARLPGCSAAAAVAAMARRLRHAARLTRPDLLHAHPPLANAWAALRAGRRLGLPVLIQLPATLGESLLARTLALHAARRADAVGVPSAAMLRELQGRGLPAGRLLLAPEPLIGVPPRQPRDPVLAARLSLDQGPVLGITVADSAVLLAALPALLRRHPRLRVLLLGGAAAPSGMAAVASGPIPRGELGRYLDLVDILVWPQPEAAVADLVLLDAMARGAVLAASDIPVHRELILHGKNGVLFEAGHPGALLDSLGALLDEPGCWPRLRIGARQHAEREFGASACAARYAPVYTQLLEQRGMD
jgi:glycogen(starch) synthase